MITISQCHNQSFVSTTGYDMIILQLQYVMVAIFNHIGEIYMGPSWLCLLRTLIQIPMEYPTQLAGFLACIFEGKLWLALCRFNYTLWKSLMDASKNSE